MARLNKTEKLICDAAKSTDTLEARVFNKLVAFYEILDVVRDEINIDIINYLYRYDHTGKTFDNIARSFFRSVSKLEGNRKDYQKTFLILYNTMKTDNLKVA